MHTTITSKGQVTLPKALRDELQLAAGDRIEFHIDEDDSVRLQIKRVSISRLKGIAPRPAEPVSLEQMEHAIRAGASRA